MIGFGLVLALTGCVDAAAPAALLPSAAASEALGLHLDDCPGGSAPADVLALDPRTPCLLPARTGATPSPAPEGATLPKIPRAQPATGAVVLLSDTPDEVAAAAIVHA